MNIYEQLKNKEPLKVATHYDADGCYSAALLSTVFKIDRIFFPWIFGDYAVITEQIGKDIIEHIPDVAMDLGLPISGEYSGIVIDHHKRDDVEVPEEITYIFDDIPTTGIVYNLFRDKIPDEHKWKVAGGMVGDGQPEKIPIEIWEMFPELLETAGNIYKTRYGKYSEYPYPIYKHLSSPVNASCRMGSPETAYEVIKRAKTPFDIINNPALKSDKDALNQEINNVFKNGVEEHNITRYLSVVIIHSDKRIGSRICSALGNVNSNKTWIVINDGTKKFSLRGDLADYIGTKLQDNGVTCGGHAGFYGGSISDEQDGNNIIEILRRVLR